MPSIEPEMPEDVLMEILTRIPVKSLLRFKSVSKYWYSLIQNPTFVSLHHTRARPKNCLLESRQILDSRDPGQFNDDAVFSMCTVPDETSPMQDLDLSFSGIHDGDGDVKGVFFLGCHNGVMCLANDFTSSIVICNPATRESRVLPPPLYESKHRSYLGFTFDPKANDYKVIRFCAILEFMPFMSFDDDERSDYKSAYLDYNNHLGDHKVQIYDMSIDSWRETDAVVPIHFPSHYQPHYCPSLDGVFYWYLCCISRDMVIAFHTFEEQFEQIPLWYAICKESGTCAELCRLHDSLALALFKYEKDYPLVETCVEIWIMDDCGVNEGWTKRYTIGPLLERHKMLGFWPNGELLLTCTWTHLLMNCNYRQILSYNHSTQEIKKYNWSRPRNGRLWSVKLQGFPYAESLISVKRLSD
ncbi:hypothetical protein Vadar_016092 [Vaccinium darrowii]|uniref:Uncharacterized protein n=1 Tax=Vaccinium darrowii TaxID=229202 RepID=A0ACB7ZJU1_9ERIC|nr:hypothetical protein Vadar_016092 [Vaccinium darrowii]